MQEQLKPCALCGHLMDADAKFCASCGWTNDQVKRPASRLFQFTLGNNLLGAMLIIAFVFGVVYYMNNGAGLSGTYGTFVGLPLLIGILTAYLTNPKSGLGATLKITTILLCAVCPFLGEGAICILM